MMIPFQTTHWENIPATEHKGETGTAIWKTLQYDKIRVRMIEYSENYKADHWCSKGHIIYCVEGEFISHLKDGREYLLSAGMSYQTSDDEENPHLSTSKYGCKLFVVDGDFLK
jgi:hypothetical protein